MRVMKRSMFSGKLHEMDLPITLDQLDLWNSGELIQNVFPNLSDDEREFLMTGITPDEWDEVFDKKASTF